MSFTLLVPTTGRITSHFGMRYHPIHKEMRMHKGLDIAQSGKHEVVAAAAGTVIRIVHNRTEGFGNFVILRHRLNGIAFETLYAHLDSIVKGLVVGKSVKPGEKLGIQGNTGASKGQHLHFEVHIPAYAAYQPHAVDPMNYISWPETRSLQADLNKLGYKLKVDGIPGDKTKQAVKDFQRKNKLVVDGKAGPATLAAIKNGLEPKKVEVKPVANEKKKDEVHSSIRKEFEAAIEDKITTGERPNENATRAEAAVMVYRAQENVKKFVAEEIKKHKNN